MPLGDVAGCRAATRAPSSGWLVSQLEKPEWFLTQQPDGQQPPAPAGASGGRGSEERPGGALILALAPLSRASVPSGLRAGWSRSASSPAAVGKRRSGALSCSVSGKAGEGRRVMRTAPGGPGPGALATPSGRSLCLWAPWAPPPTAWRRWLMSHQPSSSRGSRLCTRPGPRSPRTRADVGSAVSPNRSCPPTVLAWP